MFKIGNYRALNKISKEIFTHNKMRNIFLTLALTLAIVLFTVTLIIGSNSIKTISLYEGKEYIEGEINGETNEFLNEVNSRENSFETVSSIYFSKEENLALGNNIKEVYANEGIKINYVAHPKLYKDKGITLSLGRYPKDNKEIIISQKIFQGLNGVSINDSIVVNKEIYNAAGKVYRTSESFKIVGLIDDKEQGDTLYTSNIKTLSITKSIVIAILAIISSTSYLLIYNILCIHVIYERKTYDLLRILGVKGKDIGRILFYQGIRCCFIAMPIGIIVGVIVIQSIGKKVIELTGYTLVEELNYPVSIFILAILIVFIILKMSCIKPESYVKDINFYRDEASTTMSSKGNNYLIGGRVKLRDIALGNVFSNKKRISVSILSMLYASVILIFLINTTVALDSRITLQSLVKGDYTLINLQDNNEYYEEVIERVNLIKGVELKEELSQEIFGNKIEIFLNNDHKGEQRSKVEEVLRDTDKSKIKVLEANRILSEVERLQRGIISIGFVLSLVVGLIALLNISNSTLSSLIARKREFGILRAIGMKKSEVLKLILLEGFFTFIFAAIPVVTIGVLVANYFTLLIPYYAVVSTYTVVYSLGITLAILFAINMLVPYISYVLILKKDLFNRLYRVISY